MENLSSKSVEGRVLQGSQNESAVRPSRGNLELQREEENEPSIPDAFDDLEHVESLIQLAEEFDRESEAAEFLSTPDDFDDGMLEDDLFDDEDF